MARPREFDVDVVLGRVADVFWQRGYEATSIRDLEGEVGVGRGSLYAAYGDKHTLYLSALDRYCAASGAETMDRLEQPGPALDAIRDVLLAAAGQERGCFMLAATTERAACDPDVAARAAAARTGGEQLFSAVLRRAQAEGELSRDADPVALARFVANANAGLLVSARSGAGPAALRQVVDLTMSVLR